MTAEIAKSTKKYRAKRRLRRLIITLTVITALFAAGAGIYLFGIIKVQNFQKLDPEKLDHLYHNKIEMFDAQNNPIDNPDKMTYVEIDKIPTHTLDTFISIEDKKFYRHNGFDFRRIVGAGINNIRSKSLKEGGSTISQQLIKNTHLKSDKTARRKLEEAKLTRELEKHYTKDRIIEYYLNIIYFGNGYYGINEATNGYFGKEVKDLSVSESAMLAGIISSPGNYSPAVSPEKAEKRRRLVLREMKKDGKISAADYEEYKGESVAIRKTVREKGDSGYYAAALSRAAALLKIDKSALTKQGYKIYTHLDASLQQSLIAAWENEAYLPFTVTNERADRMAVIIDNKTGGIVAYAGEGAHDPFEIKRQPGSAIKPAIVYAPALKKGIIHPARHTAIFYTVILRRRKELSVRIPLSFLPICYRKPRGRVRRKSLNRYPSRSPQKQEPWETPRTRIQTLMLIACRTPQSILWAYGWETHPAVKMPC